MSTSSKAIILLLIFLTGPVLAADIPITPTSGCTYITWAWTPGITLDDMFIDGNLMCGYETTANTYTITGLDPNEPHSIYIINGTDTGYNLTSTLNCPSGGTGVVAVVTYNELPMSPAIPVAGVLIAAAGFLAARRKK